MALGITSLTSITLVNKLDIEKSLTESDPLRDLDGEIVDGDARDPVFDINIEGKGDLPASLVAAEVGGLTITGVTGGKTIVEKATETEFTDKYNEFKAAVKNFPSAS